jgi:hypothetical protein
MAVAVAAAGCGGGDDASTAKDEPVEVSVASEPLKPFIMRMTKLLETTTAKKDCGELESITVRSVTQFACPAPQELRRSMARFEVVGAEEYGTGGIVDYKSGKIKDGAAIVLFVAPNRNWAIGRFGVITKPSTNTSDAKSRAGYAKAVDKYLAAIRERDCDAYFSVTYNGNDKRDAVCKKTFAATKKMATLLKSNPDAAPHYEGGNGTYGFYSLETRKPDPANVTISLIKASPKSAEPFVVLDIAPSPTAAEQKSAEKAFRQKQRQKSSQDMSPSSKPVDN